MTALRSELPEWKALEAEADRLSDTRIDTLFKDNPKRFDDFHVRAGSLLLDYSKQNITRETTDKLCALARACQLEEWRDKMFTGDRINMTENRAVLHTALRGQCGKDIFKDDKNIYDGIRATLEKMQHFTDSVRTEKNFTDVISIGIGGSDLGSVMASEALAPFTDRDITTHFVSNVDSTHLSEALRRVNPEKTLIIVVSKTFTTQETMTNATSARDWLRAKLGKDDVSDHFVAISQNIDGAKEFGINEENIFPIWDWVGGRFSIWSAVGLPLCLAIGYENFSKMLQGAHAIDKHFLDMQLEQNLPVILGLIGIWNRNFLNHNSLAVVPYDQYLHRFPAYLQQLDMESNGKSIDRNNREIPYKTGPIIFGESGTNAQHAFFQLIHQGKEIIPCEFIMTLKSQNDLGDHQQKLLANVIAQSKALMDGKDDSDPHKKFKGNRPSNTLVLDELTPYTLGMLIALYEHKIFVQGVIWNINSFDQCGVELGKILAKQIIATTQNNEDMPNQDSSTQALLDLIKESS